jgi:methylglutaconyl-CoA hydratase
MAFPETKSMGIIPGLGGTHRLPQIVSRNQGLELILTNRRIKVGRASYLGLGKTLVEPSATQADTKLGTREPIWATEEKALNLEEDGQREACLARALKTAKGIAQAAPLATRAVLAAMVSKERPKGELEENMAYESLLGTQDRKEALTAFAEKRKPVFVGR